MNVQDDAPGHGTPEMLSETVAELLTLVSLHARLGVGHARAGDVTGTVYSVRKTLTYLRAAAGTAADLVELVPPDDEWVLCWTATKEARR